MTEPAPSPTMPRSVGLLSRRSITGAVVVSLIALLYIVGVPALQRATDDNPFAAGEPFVAASGTVRITPQPGWELEGDGDLFASLTKSGASLLITPAVEAEGEFDDFSLTVLALENDEASAWSIGDVQRFTTDAGDDGAYLASNSATLASISWRLFDGERTIDLIGASPSDVWGQLADEMDAMVRSVEFVEVDE